MLRLPSMPPRIYSAEHMATTKIFLIDRPNSFCYSVLVEGSDNSSLAYDNTNKPQSRGSVSRPRDREGESALGELVANIS